MGELGKILQETRESKNITLEEIDIALKIKPRYIEAIEAENLDIFPSVPMARGFIKNYAIYLGLDPAELLTLHDQNGASKIQRRFSLGQGITFMSLPMARRRSLFNGDSLVTLLIIIALVGSASFFAYTQYLEPSEVQATAFPSPVEYQFEEKNPAAITLPTPTPIPTETPTPTPTATPQYYTGVTVELVLHKRSWVQILVDDVKTFEGTLQPGDRPSWGGDKRVAIRAGNGGGIEVYVNGQNMGFMGEDGQVIDQVWEKVEEIPGAEPNATATPSP